MNELHPGAVVDGRYTIIGPLASGGMGAVYRAEHRKLKRAVAIKILRADAQPGWAERFCREARAACSLRHPNIVTTLDFGTDPESQHAYLALELIEGRSLSEERRRVAAETGSGLMPVGRACHVLAQTCAALGEAHRCGVVHRDIKPANIMLSRVGDDPDFVTVIDFGIARVLEGPDDLTRTLTAAGELIGTPAYMAPETFQVRGGPPSDVYAVGVLAYQLLIGQRPFNATKLADLIFQIRVKPAPPMDAYPAGKRLDPALIGLVARCLQKDPQVRPSMHELRISLGPFVDRTVLDMTPATSSPRLVSELDVFETIGKSEMAGDATAPARPGSRVAGHEARPAVLASEVRDRPVTVHTSPPWRLMIVGLFLALGAVMVWELFRSTPPHTSVSGARRGLGPATTQPRRALEDVESSRRHSDSTQRSSRRSKVHSSLAPSVFCEPLAREPQHADRLVRRALAPSPTESRKRAEVVSVRLVVRPFGAVRYKNKPLGRDVVDARVPLGRRCFTVERNDRSVRRCLQIERAQTHYTLRAP
ncbi:MAG: hypothetical protein ACI9OJ_002625 [Myxococcota bacterium]